MIKLLNEANANVKRPLRVSDLQDIWIALKKINAVDIGTTPKILAGFHDKGNGFLSEGLIAMNGVIYYHPDTLGFQIEIGNTIYGHSLAGVDQRVFADATTQDFSYNLVARNTVSGVVLGELTLENVAKLRVTGEKYEVTGTLNINLFSGTNITFTPDSDIGGGLVISHTTDTKNVKIKVENSAAVEMSRCFDIVPVNSGDMLDLLASDTLPDAIFGGVPSDPYSMVFHWVGDVPTGAPRDFRYRIRISFDA